MNVGINQEGFASVQFEELTSNADGGELTGDMGVDGMNGEVGAPGSAPKESIMSNWGFVIGISAATLVVSIVLGILLAKKRIKKGFDLYEN